MSAAHSRRFRYEDLTHTYRTSWDAFPSFAEGVTHASPPNAGLLVYMTARLFLNAEPSCQSPAFVFDSAEQ